MLIDLLFFAIIAVMIFVCHKKGFAISLFNASSALISIVLVFVLKNPVSDFIKNSFFGKNMYQKLFGIIRTKFFTGVGNFADSNNVPGIFSDILTSDTKISNDVITFMTDRIYELGIFVATFLIIIIIVKIITKVSPNIIKLFTRIPVIKQFDKVFGILFGFVYGIIWSVIVVYAMNILSIYINSEFLDTQVVNSFVSSLLNNIL